MFTGGLYKPPKRNSYKIVACNQLPYIFHENLRLAFNSVTAFEKLIFLPEESTESIPEAFLVLECYSLLSTYISTHKMGRWITKMCNVLYYNV